MHSRDFISFVFLALSVYSPLQAVARSPSLGSLDDRCVEPHSPFSIALETLQKQINYTFKSSGLLRRAMTHASFSEENNKALSILGASLIETSVALLSIEANYDISAKDLNLRVSGVSNVESSCAVDGMRLGLQNVVRVSPKTNSSTPAVVCGAFRALFGAVAVDTGKSDDAGIVFWRVHGYNGGRALAL